MTKLEGLICELCPNGVDYKMLSDVLKIKNGGDYKKFPQGQIPVYGSGGIIAYIDRYAYDKPSVLIPRKGSIDKLYYVDIPFWTVDTIFYTEINTEVIEPKYVYYYLQKQHLETLNTAGGVPSLTQNVLNKVQIPVPPLEVQREIVRILDNFTELTVELTAELIAELIARKKQYAYYRDTLLVKKVRSMTRWIKLGEVGKVSMCKRIMKAETSSSGDIPFYKIGTFGGTANSFISKDTFHKYKKEYSYPKKGDVLISAAGTIGRTVIFDGEPAYFQDSNIVWIDNDESVVLNKYLFYYYQLSPWKVSEGGTIPRLYNDNIASTIIAVPSIEEQEIIIDILDRLNVLCDILATGLSSEIEARQNQYEYYRDKLLTFKELNE